MYQIMEVSGGSAHSLREYDIAGETQVDQGQVVKLTQGLVTAAAAGETGPILGVAAEYHSGAEDALNPRSNGGRLLVWDSPGAVFACPAPQREAGKGCTATSVVCTAASGLTASTLAGGWIRDGLGACRRITAASGTGGTLTLTVETGAVLEEGERFLLFPPVGFHAAGLDEAGAALSLDTAADLSLTVAGRDEGAGLVWLVPRRHVLACASQG